MKNLTFDQGKYLKISLILLGLIFCNLSTPCNAQSFFSKLFKSDGSRRKSLYEKHSDISFGIGTSHYYGDLAPYSKPVKSTLQNMNWNFSVGVTRHFSPHFSGRASLTWVRLTGDDNKFEGIAGLEQLYMRNAHFRNDVQELAITGMYHFIPETRSFRNRVKLNPYLFAGISVFHHDPVAKAPTDYGGTEASPGEWVSLQPLSTEGQGLPNYPDQTPYNLINVNIPFGAGVRYKLNRDWDLGFEVGVRYTFSDYLDDVGGYFADRGDLTKISDLSAAMGHRENEKIAALTGRDREAFARTYYLSKGYPLSDPNLFPIGSFPELDKDNGGVRNSSSRLNDMYVLTSFKIIYHLAPSIKCPVIR